MSIESKLQQTDDGSLSLLDAETGELYHNRAGAYAEALNTYCLPSGILERLTKPIDAHADPNDIAHADLNVIAHAGAYDDIAVIDACFGLGYNTFVLLEQAARQCDRTLRNQPTIKIMAFETDAEVLEATEFVLRDERFPMMHDALRHSLPLTFGSYKFACGKLNCELEIRQVDLRVAVPKQTGDFDVIFHDPFSPRKVPELWTLDLFREYHRLLSARYGRLLTYSAAKAVRGAALAAGFTLFKTAAVGGKTGGTLAAVDHKLRAGSKVLNLSPEELKVVQSTSGTPYRDSGFTSAREDILSRRQRELVSE